MVDSQIPLGDEFLHIALAEREPKYTGHDHSGFKLLLSEQCRREPRMPLACETDALTVTSGDIQRFPERFGDSLNRFDSSRERLTRKCHLGKHGGHR